MVSSLGPSPYKSFFSSLSSKNVVWESMTSRWRANDVCLWVFGVFIPYINWGILHVHLVRKESFFFFFFLLFLYLFFLISLIRRNMDILSLVFAAILLFFTYYILKVRVMPIFLILFTIKIYSLYNFIHYKIYLLITFCIH